MKTKLTILSILLTGTFVYTANCQTKKAAPGKQTFFTPNLTKGQKLANIYSRAIAYSGDDFTTVVLRVSGSSTYEVIDNSPVKPSFNETDLYDGRPANTGVCAIGLDGKGTYGTQSFTNTSASGLLYSSLLWGNAPPSLKEGDTWQADITQPWELGGAGKQIIKVIAIDTKNNTITLLREGSSEGFYDGDRKQVEIITKDKNKVMMNLTPGTSHWSGYTTFKDGIVMADELLVTRAISLSSDSLHFTGNQREYILLNAMPVEKL
jgi:hypothetical protein